MAAMFVTITGLIVTLFGVGGIEQSIADSDLWAGILVALVGCGIMCCGVLMIQQEEQRYYKRSWEDEVRDNSTLW